MKRRVQSSARRRARAGDGGGAAARGRRGERDLERDVPGEGGDVGAHRDRHARGACEAAGCASRCRRERASERETERRKQSEPDIWHWDSADGLRLTKRSRRTVAR